MDRILDRKKFSELIKAKGGISTVSYEAGVGHSTLTKLLAGSYPAQPKDRLRAKICKYFGIKEDDLFLPAKPKQRAS